MRLIDAHSLKVETQFAPDGDIDFFYVNIEEIAAAPVFSPNDAHPPGEWVKGHDDVCWWWECSVCHEPPLQRRGNDVLSSYCPNCGAEMIEVSDEDEFN